MNQVSTIPFGTDASVLAGYAQYCNDRLGTFDLVVENTGVNTLSMQLRELVGSGSTASYVPIASFFTVAAGGGKVTKHLSLCSQQLGFFGSGSTTANVSVVIANKGDLRGAQMDIVVIGRTGWGITPPSYGDPGYAINAYSANWGPAPDNASAPQPGPM